MLVRAAVFGRCSFPANRLPLVAAASRVGQFPAARRPQHRKEFSNTSAVRASERKSFYEPPKKSKDDRPPENSIREARTAVKKVPSKPSRFNPTPAVLRLKQVPPNRPWVPLEGYSTNRTPLSLLSLEIADFATWVEQRSTEIAVRTAILEAYEKLARQYLDKGARIAMFGSSATGLNLPNSDLDLILLGYEMKLKPRYQKKLAKKPRDLATMLLQAFRVKLRQNKLISLSADVVFIHAKVPIIKLRHTSTNLMVDISSTTTEESLPDVLRYIDCVKEMIKDDRVKRLTFLLKRMLNQQELDNPATGGLGGFATTCWANAFVQAYDKHIFETQPAGDSSVTDIGPIFIRFLQHYTGDTTQEPIHVPTVDFNVDNVSRQGTLSIIDPVNASNNVAKAFTRPADMVELFQYALTRLQPHLSSPTHSRTHTESPLTPLLGFTNNELAHRSHIEALGTALLRNPSNSIDPFAPTKDKRFNQKLKGGMRKKSEAGKRTGGRTDVGDVEGEYRVRPPRDYRDDEEGFVSGGGGPSWGRPSFYERHGPQVGGRGAVDVDVEEGRGRPMDDFDDDDQPPPTKSKRYDDDTSRPPTHSVKRYDTRDAAHSPPADALKRYDERDQPFHAPAASNQRDIKPHPPSNQKRAHDAAADHDGEDEYPPRSEFAQTVRRPLG
ncbi:uncharacterized protein EV422DRAFT_568228 [Fimicolochytrium jonesii]|uniref:uncharacterized protein n=1 Tax=Fimicolochytrium jonesii TaxID=1396493 RepID=UPI0022FE6A7F|nr:uncharacterized protein EV422DRAFT_568228 [Fimicolochytrium jonesii]KAI8820263.1 hypothetical protein EV422DRAFT_568228 [Fimicolochytrium jonesii]